MTTSRTDHMADRDVGRQTDANPDFEHLLEQGRDHLADISPEFPVGFTFGWRGVAFTARVRDVDGAPELSILGDIGPLPYSSEHSEARKRLLMLTRRSGQNGIARFSVIGRQRVGIFGRIGVSRPTTGADILVAACKLLLGLQPWLDLALRQMPERASPAAARGPVSSAAAG